MTHAVEIRPATEADQTAWDAFVLDHSQGTVFHRPAWSQAVAATYPHRPNHLLAWRGDTLTGVLPLFFVRSRFVGRVLVSVPYATYGGILAADDETARALLARAEQLAADCRAEYIELRHRDESPLDLPVLDRYDTFRKRLPDDPAAILPSLPKKTRAAARKGRTLCTTAIGPEWLDAIYDLYALTMRRLGSPNFRRRLFRQLAAAFGPDCICLAVLHNDQPLAGVVSFRFRNELVAYFSGSNDQARETSASNLMYLRLMEWTVEAGLDTFDFNRTRRDNAGPYDFKRHHDFTPQPLHYQIDLIRGEHLPNLSPSNRKFALAGRVWKHLPLWLTRPAGDVITSWIP
jgi:FemAB-related protein (PEP-CTERM system-associated)